jgi:hypothetical protein
MIKLKVRHTPTHTSTPWMVPVPKVITGTHRVRKFFTTEAEATAYINRVELDGFNKADLRIGAAASRFQSIAERWKESGWAGSEKSIEQLYAWTAIGPDGEEAIIALSVQGVQCPLIDSDRKRIKSLREYAEQIGKLSRRPVQFVTFQRVESSKGGTIG